jgi:transposase
VRSVAVKTPQQQARLMQHMTPELLIRQSTQLINALRSHMGELGLIVAQGREGLRERLAIVRDETDRRLPDDARVSLSTLAAQLVRAQRRLLTLRNGSTLSIGRTRQAAGLRRYLGSALWARPPTRQL